METVLLNPATPVKPPASQQNTSEVDSDNGDFSPAMDEAINSLDKDKGQNQGSTAKGSEQEANTPQNNELSNITEATENKGQPQENVPVQALNGLIKAHDAITTHMPVTVQDRVTQPILSGSFQQSPVVQENPLVQQNPLNSFGTEKNPLLADSLIETSVAPNLVAKTSTPLGTENSLQGASKAETLLLQQIQQILDQGKNTGSITITSSNPSLTDPQKSTEQLQGLSASLLAEAENSTIQSRQVGVVPIVPMEKNAPKPNSIKLEGAHQDVNEQFLNAKLGESKVTNPGNPQQGNNDQKGNKQQNKAEVINAMNQSSVNSGSETKPGESTFGQQLTTSATPTTTPTSVEGKLAPGVHQPVPENELVDNLIKRFSVNPRLQTSKLTLQLNPAELGAIKIDILVKGDSINANIVAQSQQVLETLEKQMPRLRSVLQEQGFTVDSFEVTMEGDGGNQRELFQEQFTSNQQEFASNSSSKNNNDTFDLLLDDQEEDENSAESSGINLKV